MTRVNVNHFISDRVLQQMTEPNISVLGIFGFVKLLFDTTASCLTSLKLQYGMMNVGMDYDRSLFGMKLSDCRSLAKALERTETLTYLNLSGNLLDDEKVLLFPLQCKYFCYGHSQLEI